MTTDSTAGVGVQQIRRLLGEIKRIAEHASLTGSLQQGARSAAQSYNLMLQRLEAMGRVPIGLFAPLADNVSFDELGVASALLASFIDEEEEEDEPTRQERRAERRAARQKIVLHSVNGLQDFEELRELGQLIREHLPDWLQWQKAGPRSPSSTAPFTEPPAPPSKEPPAGSSGTATNASSETGSSGDLRAQIQTIAAQLQQNDLSPEQRRQLIDQLAQLGQQHMV